jgi:glucosamine--fructose-6-phosphate aminotransferase (isomerizing)
LQHEEEYKMTTVEADIGGTPDILRRTVARVDEVGEAFAAHLRGRPLLVLGCGSSHAIGLAVAALYEDYHALPAQAVIASEYRPRPGWAHLAISRTGRTSELIEAMRQARAAGDPAALLVGDRGSAAEAESGAVLSLDFAAESGVIQTRFVSATLLALRLVIDTGARAALADLPAQVEAGLAAGGIDDLARHDHVVFLGRRERYGLARLAALNLQETALVVAEAHQTLDYRHGPIASAGPGSLIWCFDRPDDPAAGGVLDDARATGATVYGSGDDPQVMLAQAQLAAVRQAWRRSLDPDAPRHLSRAVVLPSLEGA